MIVFGYLCFRGRQLEVVEYLLAERQYQLFLHALALHQNDLTGVEFLVLQYVTKYLSVAFYVDC
jgi:hypothetical protein